MSLSAAPSPDLAPAPRGGAPLAERDLVARRVEPYRALLEGRLAAECEALGEGLGGLADVIARAVGTEGRGGGRWRPLLALAAAEACGGAPEDALDAAVAVELTHTASLVLDDLPCMDDAALRRGQPATHRLVGSAGAILLSVAFLARAVELLGRDVQAGGTLAAAWGRTVGLRGMAGGQAVDVSAKGSPRGAARRLHREKSTALPAFALLCGAAAAGAPAPSREGLEAFGRGLGWAYQLRDDACDLEEDGRLGRASATRHPLARSLRLLRGACRRLGTVPGLHPEGVEVLTGLARRIVRLEPIDPRPLAEDHPSRRG